MWGRLPPRLLCNRHNPAFLQRTGSGSHLYTANLHTLRSVHRVEVLLALVGTHLFVVALPSPFVPLLYHTLRDLSRGFLNFFCSVGRFCFTSPNYALGRGCSLLSASLHPYCITTWAICQGVSYVFSDFFSKAPTPVLRSQWQAFIYGYPLPLTSLVYHRLHQKSIGNFAQIRDFLG